ncbi:MAG: hypothetical protein C4524_05455 [Candidatus Zixiibacteriota bacterium]|nr:MAG: hypothetical protein C4524_05455 [candidate division Zixibacteria bacterium]
MHLLVRLGLLEIAFSALAVPLLLYGPAQRLFPHLLKDRRQLLQAHLDYFLMGILLILAGTVLQPLPGWITLPLALGSLGNPSLFLVNALRPDLPQKPLYRGLIMLSGLLAAFAWAGMAVRAVI